MTDLPNIPAIDIKEKLVNLLQVYVAIQNGDIVDEGEKDNLSMVESIFEFLEGHITATDFVIDAVNFTVPYAEDGEEEEI